jgi:DNA-directed RNA polymerase I and III subunit RPAC2
VTFCGYSIPHPTESVVNLRVQTAGETTAAHAVRGACADLKQVCGHIDAVFTAAVEEFKAQHPQAMETDRRH